MKYTYVFDQDLYDDVFRESAKYLGAKEKETKLPKIVPNSHEEMVFYLRDFNNVTKDLNPQIIDAIEKYDRNFFFTFDSQSETLQNQQLTPYTFMAPVFMDGQTIPSPHIVMANAHFLNLKKGQRILEIGAGSGYVATILANSSDLLKMYSTEINEDIFEFARKNISQLGLEDKIKILKAQKGILGLPNEERFDKIHTTLAANRHSQIEQLLDQLNVGGNLLMPIVKIGNYSVKEKLKTRFWEPGEDVAEEDIYVSNPEKGFVRTITYMFEKVNEDEIKYGRTNVDRLGPRLL